MSGRRARVEIGDPDGKIALFLNERSAFDLAAKFPYPDTGGIEILEAIRVAYPDSPPQEGGNK